MQCRNSDQTKNLRHKALRQRPRQDPIAHGLPSSTSRLAKLAVPAKEPHIYTATMASGYGLAGGTYTICFPGSEERLSRRRGIWSGRNGWIDTDTDDYDTTTMAWQSDSGDDIGRTQTNTGRSELSGTLAGCMRATRARSWLPSKHALRLGKPEVHDTNRNVHTHHAAKPFKRLIHTPSGTKKRPSPPPTIHHCTTHPPLHAKPALLRPRHGPTHPQESV